MASAGPTVPAKPVASGGVAASQASLEYEASKPFAHRLAWRLGLGLAVGAAAVVVAGLVFLRRQAAGT